MGRGASRAGVLVLAAISLFCSPSWAGNGKRDIRGIALGATAEQIVRNGQPHCAVNKLLNVSCEDKDGSEYKVFMSGGKPSVAMSIKQTFCSMVSARAVLAKLMGDYGVPAGKARPIPNGSSFEVDNQVEGILNSRSGKCADGRTNFQFTLSDDGLMAVKPNGGSAAGAKP